MKELHFAYGTLGIKRFILPIAESFKGDFQIYCQLANKDVAFKHKKISYFPAWFNLKFSFSSNTLFFFPSCFYLYLLFKRNKNINVVAHMTTYAFFPLFIAFLAGIKNRTYFNHGFANIDSRFLTKYILMAIEYLNTFLSTKTITVSPSHKNKMNQSLLGKIRKIQSTYPGSCCGIDISRIISEDLLNKKIKSLYKNDLIYLSYIGRPYSRKGFPYILNLFEKILEINPERKIILQIIGIKKKLILEKIKNKATLSSICIIEYTNQVDYYLRKSCFLILPSLREGFGYAFLEGASAGNALASFDITGPDSLLKSNFNALIVKKESSIDFFANYISNTLNNPRKLSALMQNARKSSFSFDKRTVLNSLRKIL